MFPALSGSFGYFENAGGSQVPQIVPDAIRDYMLSSYVQLGAGYPQSDKATQVVDDAHTFMSEFTNVPKDAYTILGPSTTALIQLVANAHASFIQPGDEIIIAESNHEANVGGWQRLERHGAKIVCWPLDTETFRCEPAKLKELITNKTRIVALPHVSNLLGQIEDLKEVSQIAHQAGAKVMADGVAYAPHRSIDIQALGVDWYVFSAYKVYGPHMAVMVGTNEAFENLKGPNHGFIAEGSAYKWELGGVSHEACAGLCAVKQYLSNFENPYQTFAKWEHPVDELIRTRLRNMPQVKIIGPAQASKSTVPTVSFVHKKIPSNEIANEVNANNFGIRNGHMYSVRICRALGIPEDPGVVRISAVHYNTVEETNRLLDLIESILAKHG